MKKIISTLLAALFIISALSVSAFTAFAAEETLDFSLTNAAGMQNDYVTIKMSIDNNPGFYAFQFGLFYDSDTLILRGVKANEDFEDTGDFGKFDDTTMNNLRGMQNDYVTIKMSIDNNPGFYAFQFGLFYDSDTLILRGVKANEDFEDTGDFGKFDDTTMNNLRDQYDADVESGVYPMSRIFRDAPKYGADVENSYVSVILFESGDVLADNMYTGEILEFTFEVVGIAEDGDYDVVLVPDVLSVINTADKDDSVPYTWTNSVITVGSKEAKPVEDNPQRNPDDTIKVDTTAKDTEAETTKKPVETFVGEDGETYYIGEDGEKYVYDPSAFEEEETVNDTPDDETASPDIDVSDPETAEKEKKNNTVLIIIIAASVLLIIAAVLLFVFISKTKKETDKIENNDNNENGQN